MLLSKLINNISARQVSGKAEIVNIENLCIDSRKVSKKSLFFAVKGFKTDGHKFIPEVISKSVPAIVVEEDNYEYDELMMMSQRTA